MASLRRFPASPSTPRRCAATGRSTTSSATSSARPPSPERCTGSSRCCRRFSAQAGAPHQLIVTTSYGFELEQAFAALGEEVDVVSYIASGRDRGKFRHIAPDGVAHVIDVPNTYAAELSLERRTVILKIRGQVGPPSEGADSFVVTEDDYIDYLGRADVASAVPVGLAATLRRSHFLFLGYTVRDWHLRLVLGRMWGDEPVAYRSWAVHPRPGPAERELWRRLDVDLSESPLESYIEGLAGRRRRARRLGGVTATGALALAAPFRGLAPFGDTELDALLFFGRERETEIAVANLLASRLTILYGPTGVGKSSLLQAGVARRVHELGGRRAIGRGPDSAAIVFSAWADDPIAALAEAIADEVTGLIERSVPRPPSGTSLADVVEYWAAVLDGDLYLVLDQLEEYFVYSENGGPRSFELELPEIVLRPRLRANVLLSLRDDALAQLDVFKGSLPNLFANYLRLDRLDRAAATAAIKGPIQRWNELVPEDARVEIEPQLVEDVLAQAAATGEPDRVEPPYLQLVLERLWNEERDRGSRTLRATTLAELGVRARSSANTSTVRCQCSTTVNATRPL